MYLINDTLAELGLAGDQREHQAGDDGKKQDLPEGAFKLC